MRLVVASQICEITRDSEKIRTYNSSRSSKVIDIDANRKRILCNFLLVINFEHTATLYRTIFEILMHKARKYLVVPTPHSILV